MRTTPRYAAVHEAGHAIAAYVLTCEMGHAADRDLPGFTAISIEPFWRDGLRIGRVETRPFYEPTASGIGDMQQRDSMERDVVLSLAGPMAQAKAQRRSEMVAMLGGGRSDYARVFTALSDFYEGRSLDDALKTLETRAKQLVRNHWRQINALADALMERECLNGEEARRIIERA